MVAIRKLKQALETKLALLLAFLWLLFLGLKTAEPVIYPVVKDFTVTEIVRVPDSIDSDFLRISGYMTKARTEDCLFVGVSAEGITTKEESVSIPLVFQDNPKDNTATRPVGYQSWGPWQMIIPVNPDIAFVKLTSIHTCNWMWATRTHLVTIPVLNQVVAFNNGGAL